MALMKLPIDNYNDLLLVMKLKHFPEIIDYFDYTGRKTIAIYLLQNAVQYRTKIPSVEQVYGSESETYFKFDEHFKCYQKFNFFFI